MFKVGVRGVNLTAFSFSTEVMGADTVKPIMSMTEAMATVTEAVAFLNVVSGLATPVTGFAIVCSPGMDSAIVNGNPSFASLSSSEIGSGVVIAINAMADASNGISGSKTV